MFVFVVIFIVIKNGFSVYEYLFFDGMMVVDKYLLKVDLNKDMIIVKLCIFF